MFKEYDELLDLFDLSDSILPDEKNFQYLKPENYKKYFDANPFNTIELDTYIVHPDYRRRGLAKVVTFEGFKIQLEKFKKKNPDWKEIFISATIHQDNGPSKRVSLAFGEFDILYVKRRTGINREVFFYKLERTSLDEFIKRNEKKIENIMETVKKDYNITLNKTELQ